MHICTLRLQLFLFQEMSVMEQNVEIYVQTLDLLLLVTSTIKGLHTVRDQRGILECEVELSVCVHESHF